MIAVIYTGHCSNKTHTRKNSRYWGEIIRKKAKEDKTDNSFRAFSEAREIV